ncbi:MAG: tetratricopeptide repeat protein [Chloroflexi bacterium]|nr:tetratricopeptide repeat protein [Chloroflexota bacterium]
MVETPPLSFGQLLRRHRRAAELTQEELAERAGISPRTVSDLERGLYQRPHRDTVQLLAEALGLTAEQRQALEKLGRRVPGSVSTEDVGSGEEPPAVGDSCPSGGEESPPVAGVMTFLITDIRGYTRFTQERGDEAAGRLAARFATVTGEVVGPHGGRVTELRGDEALAVFPSPRNALRAALELQDRLATERETDMTLPLQVGIGIDAGEAVPVEGGYRGGALNLAARLCSLAGPGEVFASEGLIHLAGSMDDLAYVDRGEAPVKGLPDPVRLIQVVRQGEASTDAPRFSVRRTPSTNLPLQPTPFIGREREVAGVRALLLRENVRLLTLTGPGGTGKTRLALRVAEGVGDAFPDGVVFVSLDSLADPELVPSAIATGFRLTGVGGRPILEGLAGHLREKHLLLLLDNFEHLLSAAEVVSHLLGACPQLKILVTSRAVLHLSAEREYPVPPLTIPPHASEPAILSGYDAIKLFVERARAVRPTFQLTGENAAAIAEICARLDGLPLAIELAAARTRLFPPQALLRHLSHPLRLLTAGAHDLPARQRTLRATIDWSYRLLTEEEQALFARLSVFAGGCAFEAAEQVCNSESELDLVAGMAALVDKSLLWQEGEDEPRFSMLETVREFAMGRLDERGEALALGQRHANYYLGLAEEAEPEVTGREQIRWLDRLEADHNNFRRAMAWLLDREEWEPGLRLAGALREFWEVRGHLSEGRGWLARFLAAGDAVRTEVRLKGLNASGRLAIHQSDWDQAAISLQESLTLSQDVGDHSARAFALLGLADVEEARDNAQRAERFTNESLRLYEQLGDPRGTAQALSGLGVVAMRQGQCERASALFERCLRLYWERGESRGIGITLLNLAVAAVYQRTFDRAAMLLEECLALSRTTGDRHLSAYALATRGRVALHRRQDEEARASLSEALELLRDLGDNQALAETLEIVAGEIGSRGKADLAVRLLGAAASLRETSGAPLAPADHLDFERTVAVLREQLDEAVWRAEWEVGRAMLPEQAIADALAWCSS